MFKRPRRRVSFVTGINQNYFLLCGTLMESLDRHFPLIPLYVMDFGLTEAQKEFFRARDMLLPMPPGLSGDTHPYTLKSCIGSFWGEDFGVPIWIDADIIAVGDGTSALLALVEAMADEDLRFAVAASHSGPGTMLQTLAAAQSSMIAPRLGAMLEAQPDLAQSTYLNVGLVLFREGDRLEDWRSVTESFGGDQCWEQNALSALCYRDRQPFKLLDARVWNAHGALLDFMAIHGEEVSCDGATCYFVHCTSPDGRHLTWGEMDFEVAGSRYKNFVKFFAHPQLADLQKTHMNNFLGANLDLLWETGVLQLP